MELNKKPILLDRDSFRESVFSRDNNECVVCHKKAKDAHHLIERRLFSDGGYYLNNGVSLCEDHHIEAEKTLLSVEYLRELAGIQNIVIPEHFYSDVSYDKWGNLILSDGTRAKGDLFYDESVQSILKEGGVLSLFSPYVKYPRTYHLPWSEGVTKDDRVCKDVSIFEKKRVIVTEKMDGENTTLYSNYIHARSIDSNNHPSRAWVKKFHSEIAHDIPEGWRVCGENLYAEHSLHYSSLDSYFMGFSIWNESNVCLSWDDSQEWFTLLGIKSVPVLYDGIFDESMIKSIYTKKDLDYHEGYVVRIAESFSYKDFNKSVAKFVRKNHVNTTKHWMHGQKIRQLSPITHRDITYCMCSILYDTYENADT